MKSLKQDQRELIFDYFLGISTESHVAEAQRLIEEHKGAAEFYKKLELSLEPLEQASIENCPKHLTELTIHRLNMAAKASQQRLENLLKNEQQKSPVITARRSFWSNFVEVGAIAAMLFIVAGIAFPTLQSARQNYWKTKCAANLASMTTGMASAETDQVLTSAAPAAGSPWWKVGYQGAENQSNTRPLWMLVRHGYVAPEAFVCPARIQGKALQFDRSQAAKLSDFPARKYVTYSFRVLCDKNSGRVIHGNRVLIADVNPVFENLPVDFGKELDIKLEKNLLNANSINHGGKGQNLVLSNGSVMFEKSRYIGTSSDDIFTVQNQTHYRGYEIPSCESDNFVAP